MDIVMVTSILHSNDIKCYDLKDYFNNLFLLEVNMKSRTICIFKNLFDIDCAGCGGTRMFLSLLKLDFYQAFRYNPYVFSLLVIACLYVIYVIVMKLFKKKVYKPSIKWLYVFLVLTFLFMLVRNLPGFEFLLPTEV